MSQTAETVPQGAPPADRGRVWRVLVVEDDPKARDWLCQAVRAHPGLLLLAACEQRAQALDWLAKASVPPDVLLTDIGLPDGSGLDVLRWVVEHIPACDCMVMSMFGDAQTVLQCIEAGAVGYLYKDATPIDIAQAILDVKAGASPISPSIARHLARRLQAGRRVDDAAAVPGGPVPVAAPVPAPEPVPMPNAEGAALSPREHDILIMVGKGFSFGEIAQLECISVHTVRTHIKGIYRKLAVHSRGEAVYEATRAGILSLGNAGA